MNDFRVALKSELDRKMGDSLENPDASVDAQSVPIADFGSFAEYIRNSASILLPEEDDSGSSALKNAVEDKSNQECIRKFLSDPQVQALYIQRCCTKGVF